MCFLLQVSGSKVRSHPVTVYPPKKPFMETEPESRAQGSLPTIELSGKVSPWASVGPVPHPSPEFPVSPALLRGPRRRGGGLRLVCWGQAVCPLPSDFLGGSTCCSLRAEQPQGQPRLGPCPIPHPLAGEAGTAVSVARPLGTQVPDRHSLGWAGAVLPSRGRAGGGPASPWYLVCGQNHLWWASAWWAAALQGEGRSGALPPARLRTRGMQLPHRGLGPAPALRPHLSPCPRPS